MNKRIDNLKISVIVSAYNEELYIGRCLRSLLHQTLSHREYEIILINDGSTDKTPYAVSLFLSPNESNITVIENEKNIGLPASLNKGIDIAQGEYIVRVDSDDFVNTNFLNFLSYYLDSNNYVEAVACDYMLIDEQDNEIERCNSFDKPIACGIMFRKDKFLDVGLYDENFLWHEEKELRVRFEKKYTINHLDLPLYRYRKHDDNITSNKEMMNLHYQKLIEKHGNQTI
jgi:glycosyltransferase involved in cell wall biosynthesis